MDQLKLKEHLHKVLSRTYRKSSNKWPLKKGNIEKTNVILCHVMLRYVFNNISFQKKKNMKLNYSISIPFLTPPLIDAPQIKKIK